jgi:spheroidene monooxygenase
MKQQTIVLSLVNYAPGSVAWGLMRFIVGRYAMQNIPGLEFFKVLGSGQHGGFDLRPSFHKQGLLCVFEDQAQADDFRENSPVLKQYQDHASEYFCVSLQTYSSKGTWAKQTMQVTHPAPKSGPIAGITRASIKFSKAPAFWSKAPPAELSLAQASGCLLAAGLGEAPYLRQATFTMWESQEAMDQYARSGAHLAAIQSAFAGAFFSESMFTRFIPIRPQGVWRGKHYG